MSKLYATDTILYGGREYQRGDELPKLEDSVVADLKDRELASTTEPKDESQDSAEQDAADEQVPADESQDSGTSRRKRA